MDENFITNRDGVPIPAKLYKYKADEGCIHLKGMISTQNLYFASPKVQPDQNEFGFNCEPELLLPYIKKDYPILLPFVNSKVLHKIMSKGLIDTSKGNAIIFCLSKSPHNNYLWKNYANNYKGYCIEFDFSHEESWITNFMFPVKYVDEIVRAKSMDDIMASATTKLRDMEKEEEIRIIFNAQIRNTSEWVQIKKSTLSSIMFGCYANGDCKMNCAI